MQTATRDRQDGGMGDRAFWVQIRRAALLVIDAIEQHQGIAPRCPYGCDKCGIISKGKGERAEKSA